MPPLTRTNFADALDPRFRELFTDEYQRDPDMVGVLYGMPGATQPWRDTERYSSVSGLPVMPQFTGTITYDSIAQMYDVTATYAEFAQGIQIERTLVEYDQKNIIEDRPRALATSAYYRRQADAARWHNNGFSVDTFFYNHTEGVALFSDNHTTTTGASTAAGFDNLVTTALNAANLTTVQIQMQGFRDEQANRLQIVGDELHIPIDLYETAFEIVSSLGKVDTANNNRNVHYGQYTIIVNPFYTDTNNWVMTDSRLRKRFLLWFDQVYPGGQPEFGQAEEFDTFVGKWRAYARWTNLWWNWRFGLGAEVS